jgi:hypothetical protein
MVIATGRTHPEPQIIEVEYSPEELAGFKAQREQYDRNWEWFKPQIVELGKTIFGKYVAVSEGELFVADTHREARELATRAHPSDQGRFVYWFPHHRLPRIYAAAR